jgi:hypothetical protein
MTIVVVGDASALRPSLDALGYAAVRVLAPDGTPHVS